MDNRIAVTRANHCKVVDTACCARKEIRPLDAGPAIFAKGALAAEQTSVRGYKLIFGIAKRFGSRLAVELIEQRLGIEGFQMTGTAGHEQKDYRLRLGMGKMRRLGRQRIYRSGAEVLVVKQRGQGESTEAAKGISEKSTTIR